MDSNTADKIHHHHQYGGGGGGGHQHRHHHHFFYISPNCPHHRPILQPNNHSPSCHFSTSYPAHQNPEPVASIINPPNPNLSFLDYQLNQSLHDSTMKKDEIEEVEDEEEEGEAIFVLTDEWRDFFAKSEAKRKLAKKQAQKGKN